MHPFTVSKVITARDAITTHTREPGVSFIAGGTDLVGLMKDRATLPTRLLDINALPGMSDIELRSDGSLRIGALARMSDVAAHPAVRQRFPVITESLLFAASAQLRNMASIGGNIMQRTRCAYFRDSDGLPCNKRMPGSGCSALHGLNRGHAIFGWSESCVATHPSDLAVALAATGALVHVRGPGGDRAIPMGEFHRVPADAPEKDNSLGRGDLIFSVEIPAHPESTKSHYLKIRDRQSYEFALVSAAAVVSVLGRAIQTASLALGGVAHEPWRLVEAEAALRGLSLDDEARLSAAIATSFSGARPLAHNGFKVSLAQRCALRALQTAGARV